MRLRAAAWIEDNNNKEYTLKIHMILFIMLWNEVAKGSLFSLATILLYLKGLCSYIQYFFRENITLVSSLVMIKRIFFMTFGLVRTYDFY